MGLLRQRLTLLCRGRLLALIRRLDHVADPSLRGRAFLQELAGEPPVVAVEMLAALEQLASARRPDAQKLFLDLLNEQAVRAAFSAGQIEEIWRLGRIRGYRRLLEVFFYTGAGDSRLTDVPRLPPDIRDIPLGRRKSMARLPAIGVLERLLADNDVSVIRNLLANPRITEREVVRLAARRPNSPGILSAVAANRHWVSRYAVKKALVYNPETPVSIAVPLLKYLLGPDLRELAHYTSANALLRREALALLDSRPAKAAAR